MSAPEEEVVQEVEEQKPLEPEYIYPPDHVEKVLEDSPITQQLVQYQ